MVTSLKQTLEKLSKDSDLFLYGPLAKEYPTGTATYKMLLKHPFITYEWVAHQPAHSNKVALFILFPQGYWVHTFEIAEDYTFVIYKVMSKNYNDVTIECKLEPDMLAFWAKKNITLPNFPGDYDCLTCKCYNDLLTTGRCDKDKGLNIKTEWIANNE